MKQGAFFSFLLLFWVLILVVLSKLQRGRWTSIDEHSLSLRSSKSHDYPCGLIDYIRKRP